MAHQLDGPRLKVLRAREHLQSLQFTEEFFFENQPYELATDFDSEANKYTYRVVRVLKELPRHRMAAVAGDCLHNLRSALDHLVWRLSDDFKRTNVEDTRTQFPIFRTGPGFDSRGRSQIQRVGPGAEALIRLLQPLHDDEPRANLLWFLRELDNSDKHRELAITAAAAKGYTHRIHHAKDAHGTFDLIVNFEDVHDGMEVGELTIKPPDARARVEAGFEFRIAFTVPSVPMTRPRLYVVPFLYAITRRVEGILDCFEPFYPSGSYDDSVVLDDPLRPLHEQAPEPELDPEDEFHERKAAETKARLLAGVDSILDEAEVHDPQVRESAHPLLVKAAMHGYLTGIDFAMERVRLRRDAELTLPWGKPPSV